MDPSYARQLFGWPDTVTISAGPRGALGQIWRVDVGASRYALKEIFAEPPSAALIEAELAFARHATEAGVRLPLSHADVHGRYLATAPDGTWLRLYEWVDVAPLDPTSPATPAELGTLLARLHQCAPATAVEPDGGAPSAWYERTPDESAFELALSSDASWAAPLARRLAELPQLRALVGRADPTRLIMCHRDLHPANVLADPTGSLVVVDWDNLGPAVPERELARTLLDFYCEDPMFDLDAMRATYEAYLTAGGPGRIREPADFTMLLATRLNFLLVQTKVANDPQAEPRHRDWAEREIAEALRTLPTPQQLAAVLEMALAVSPGSPIRRP